METKYYAYYKPNSKVELMNDIKQQLSEEYETTTVNKIISQIFNNINCNDPDIFLCSNKQNDIILIKFTLVNELFLKINNIDKTKYTLVSETNDLASKKLKNNNNSEYYIPHNKYYYNEVNNILFNGTTYNYYNDENTQYIFAEYLIITIDDILIFYKNIDFDDYDKCINNNSTFKSSLLKYENCNMLNDKLIKNILILLNNILSTEKNNSTRYYCIYKTNKYEHMNENLLTDKIIHYKNENDDLVITIWNEIYKQPNNIYDIFTDYKFIINNQIKYISPDLEHVTENINFNIFSYLYITQKKFSNINYKDALPLRLAFDTKFKYDDNINYNKSNHNKHLNEINYHNNEIYKINNIIEKLLQTKPENDINVIKQKKKY